MLGGNEVEMVEAGAQVPDLPENHFNFIVIGGGIAGVSCLEQLIQDVPWAKALLLSESGVVKQASKITRLTKTIEDFVVVEKSLESFRDVHDSVTVLHDTVVRMEPEAQRLMTLSGVEYTYDFVCLCTGATPKVVNYETAGLDFKEHVLGVRDTESVANLAELVSKSRRGLVLGNGGIATEFVYEVEKVHVVWAVKDSSISATFLDNGAAEFLLQARGMSGPTPAQPQESVPPELWTDDPDIAVPSKRARYDHIESRVEEVGRTVSGSALGPDWHTGLNLQGQAVKKNVEIAYGTECVRLWEPREHSAEIRARFGEEEAKEALDWRTYVQLSNGTHFGVDWILSATGVSPNCGLFPGASSAEHGIYVNQNMETSCPRIYAAGDVAWANWDHPALWFQMKLWTQARSTGLHAGASMADAWLKTQQMGSMPGVEPEELSSGFIFELFTHVTRFFGFKVVLLGLFNGQGLSPQELTLKLRCSKNQEYIKLVVRAGRVVGAVLIGETGYEETVENLILNGIDLSTVSGDILDPQLDLEDYFD